MSSISGDSYNNYPNTIDGLTFINVNGNNITGNYLNSITDTMGVNTNITTSIGGVFTVKDISGNELIKCDNNTSVTTFFNPRSSFTPSVASDLVNLSYLSNAYWQLSGSNNINGVFQTSGGGSIWFQNAGGVTFILMIGNGVQIRNALLTGDTNLFTIYNSLGGSNQLLQCDASGNLSNCPNLSYTYGDQYATIIQTVPSNISAQQQTLRWVRDFTVNSLYGWKLTTATINKAPLDTDLPITINNLYSNAIYPTTLYTGVIQSLTNLLNLSNSVGDSINIDNGKIRFQGTGDWGLLSSPNRFNSNVNIGFQHSFSINNVQLFRFSNTSVPTITSNNSNLTLTTVSGGTLNLQSNLAQLTSNFGGVLTLNDFYNMTDSLGNQIYSNIIGIYSQSVAGAYSLISNSGSAFLVSSSSSVVALDNNISLTSNSTNVIMNGKLYSSSTTGNTPQIGQFGSTGDRLILYQGSGVDYPYSLGIGSATLWYSVPTSGIHNWYVGGNSIMNLQNSGNDSLALTRNSQNPSFLAGVGYFSFASASTSWSPDSVTNDTVIHNASGNIRFRTGASANDSNFIINSNGSTSVKNRSASIHQFIIAGQEFYQAGNSSTGVSLNCYVNRANNKQATLMDVDLAINNTNRMLRFMPENGSVDAMSTDISTYLPLSILGSSLILGFYTTNGNLTTTGGTGTVTVVSDKRLKRDIEYLTDTKEGLNAILNLKPCKFKLIDDKSNATYQGFIADDMMNQIPCAVDGKKIEYKWKTDLSGNMELDEKGNIVYQLDKNGNKVIRPKAITDVAVIATQTLAIQELYKLLNHQNQVIQNQQTEITEYKDKVNHLLITSENLTKQLITITNQINKITEKIILSN